MYNYVYSIQVLCILVLVSPTLKGFRIKGPNFRRHLFCCVYFEYLKVTGEATIYYFVALRKLKVYKFYNADIYKLVLILKTCCYVIFILVRTLLKAFIYLFFTSHNIKLAIENIYQNNK